MLKEHRSPLPPFSFSSSSIDDLAGMSFQRDGASFSHAHLGLAGPSLAFVCNRRKRCRHEDYDSAADETQFRYL
jgi:hypothetical protein